MARRTKDQRREDYLDIGAALVAETALLPDSEPALALAHVKLAEVAARAGVTKGALYHIWPSQEAYWRDLLEHLLETNAMFGADRVARVARDVTGDSREPPALRSYANALFDSLREDPAFFARISLFSYLHDDRVRSTLDSDFRESVELVLPVLEAAVEAMGRRMADDLTVTDLAVAVSALLEGLCLQYRLSPERTPDLSASGETRWTLFAAAAEALLFGYTVPADETIGAQR